jgi:hypothetical protein
MNLAKSVNDVMGNTRVHAAADAFEAAFRNAFEGAFYELLAGKPRVVLKRGNHEGTLEGTPRDSPNLASIGKLRPDQPLSRVTAALIVEPRWTPKPATDGRLKIGHQE